MFTWCKVFHRKHSERKVDRFLVRYRYVKLRFPVTQFPLQVKNMSAKSSQGRAICPGVRSSCLRTSSAACTGTASAGAAAWPWNRSDMPPCASTASHARSRHSCSPARAPPQPAVAQTLCSATSRHALVLEPRKRDLRSMRSRPRPVLRISWCVTVTRLRLYPETMHSDTCHYISGISVIIL